VPPRAERDRGRSAAPALYDGPVSTPPVTTERGAPPLERAATDGVPLSGLLIVIGSASLFGMLGVMSRSKQPRTVPHMTEAWYCCAEPSAEDMRLI